MPKRGRSWAVGRAHARRRKRDPVIDRRVKTLLKILEDGLWHDRIFEKKMLTLRLAEACVLQGLVRHKLVKIPDMPDHFQEYFRITGKGRRALREGAHPTREEINYAIENYVHL
ncbi:MAG TPA: hypothetical protein VI794_02435 [Patescibacteria group bacterium]|nr:hypothetical protein [Patescibacteria group bacterium]